MNIAQSIRYYRKAANLTQDQLASLAGLSKNFICQLEKGNKNPSMKSLKSIADALEIESSTLVGFDPVVEELREIVDKFGRSRVEDAVQKILSTPAT